MSDNQNQNCIKCGKPVVVTASGVAHVDGGMSEQKCQNGSCGWSGGQADNFQKCPRCGDATFLVTDHVASV